MTKTVIYICLLTAFFWQPTTLTARSPFPLETLYVQTDKQTYFTGETIWFRAFLVNSQTHVQDTLSRYVYAELINSQREVVNRVMIRHGNGVFAGHIPVTEDLEAGVYNLRFFTRHLENFGEEYFFQRVIHIITPQSFEEVNLSEQVGENDLSEDTPTINPNDSFSVSFHPEGGDIPIGIETLIAFNAINYNGLGEHIQGVIVNAGGDTITHFESAHLGMGAFEWMANSDEPFFAIAQNTAGIEKTFEFPRAREGVISLQIFRHEGNIIVYLPQLKTGNRVLYLSLKQRGIRSSERWDNESEILVISENDLPTGVVGIVLSDAQGVPLSKRQIFNINKLEKVNTVFTTNRDVHGTRERVNATVAITDNENRPLGANFSISVIDNDITSYDASVNILSTLLLTSDLRGHIEEPAYYFTSKNENIKEYLDLVMLTHGWTRFDVSRKYHETTPIAWQDFETSQTITGTLRGGFLRRSTNQSVNLLAPLFTFFDVVYTDREGRFRFEHFELPENTEFILQSVRDTRIYVDKVAFPAVTNFFIPTKANNMPVFNNELIEEFHRLTPEDDIWSAVLDEFVFIHRVPRSHRYRRIEGEDIARYENMFDNTLYYLVLRRFSHQGLRAVTVCRYTPLTKLTFNFFACRFSAREAFILVDDRQVTSNCLRNFFIRGVESISVITDLLVVPDNYSGAIIITTDGSSFPSRYQNAVRITPLGYQITREFFSPAYTTPEQRANERLDLRATVFWNPSVTTGENGKVEVHFYTSDNTGNYVVIIEGITDEGRIVHLVSRLL